MTERWSPFRKLTQEEQRGIIMRTHSERCSECGGLLIKGERALLGRSSKRLDGATGYEHTLWRRHDGTWSLKATFRHLGC